VSPTVRIAEYLRGLDSPAARVKYGSSKALRLLSTQNPKLLYPYFDTFAEMLAGKNTILGWNSAWIVGNLAAVDHEHRIDKLLRRFFAPITGTEMIAAANVIGAAAEVALARPDLADRIAREILKVETACYQKPECRNVAIGHAITALDPFFPSINRKRPVMQFVYRHIDNPGPATRKKAEKFSKNWTSLIDGRPLDALHRVHR